MLLQLYINLKNITRAINAIVIIEISIGIKFFKTFYFYNLYKISFKFYPFF